VRKLGDYAVYGSNGQVGRHDSGLTSGKTIIVGRKGSIGEVHFSEYSCWPIDTTYFIDESCTDCDLEWLFYSLRYLRLDTLNKASGVPGLNREDAYKQEVCQPTTKKAQQRIAAQLRVRLTEVAVAQQAAEKQAKEISHLANALVLKSIRKDGIQRHSLGEVLREVKLGVGERWVDYPVLGATRDGLAPAKEAPGKHAPKYKPVLPGTVFYNPMRILIGSIAFVDEDDTPGITSPDYVALRGTTDKMDSRWFYYWLRSPLGAACISSLARGAVRERMLFNRLAEGEIELPALAEQERASNALRDLKPLKHALEGRLREISLLPQRILSQAFEN
jgi:type I restriction enzyme S subunit